MNKLFCKKRRSQKVYLESSSDGEVVLQAYEDLQKLTQTIIDGLLCWTYLGGNVHVFEFWSNPSEADSKRVHTG